MNNLFQVFMLLAQIKESFTQIQSLRYSVFVCFLVPHVNTQNKVKGQNVTLLAATESHSLMRYCDTDSPIYDHDDYMNRIVAIAMHNSSSDTIGSGQIFSTGVFINRNHVLTSFNPYRDIIKSISLSHMFVYYYRAKWYQGDAHHGYYIGTEGFACARQVVPMAEHRVRHDLLVIKTKRKVTFLEAPSWGSERDLKLHYVGPLQTELAGEGDALGDDLKFASLGFIDEDHIHKRNHLHTVAFSRDDGVIADCDEWCNREWGYFICIENVDEYVGIGSGALLFSDEKVFGVGTFALKRGGKSVLVFTDIRPYSEIINLTCTAADFN